MQYLKNSINKMRLQIPKLNRYTVLFILLVVFVFIEIIIMSPSQLEKKNEDFVEPDKLLVLNPEIKKDVVDQKMRGIQLFEKSEGDKGYKLFASEAVGTSDLKWVLKTVKVQFFTENRSNYSVTGDVGETDGISKDIVIRGNVTTISANGFLFKTDTLRYSAQQKIMTSVDAVTMEGPPDKDGKGFHLTGEKLLVDLAKNKMSILDKILTVKVINDKNFRLTAVRADFTNQNQEALFSGDVKMNLGTFYVHAPLAHFIYSATTKSLVKILLKNGVAFVEGDRSGTCNELEMDLAENKMTLRGQPKVQQGEDEIRGQEIVFIDGGKKVKINNSKKEGKK